jgi:hypothetical protein
MKLYMKGSLRGDVDAQKVLDLFPKDEGRGIRVPLAGRLKLFWRELCFSFYYSL